MSSTGIIPSANFNRTSASLDLYAASLSALCVIHCLALPLLVPFLAFAAPFAENEAVHAGMVLLAAPISLWVIYHSRSLENFATFALAAGIGLGLLVAAAFLESLETLEAPITVSGAVLLGSAHMWRWLKTRRDRQPATENDRDCHD